MNRKVNVIEDLAGKKTVVIQDICFRGRRSVNWDDVEKYLLKYIGEFYLAAESGDEIYIGSDLPSEYSGTIYTRKLKGLLAKAKANAAQGIPEMIEIAGNPLHEKNRKKKHSKNAKLGWYRYNTRFALPVYTENGEIECFNVFNASLLIRHANDGKKYLYDLTEIKKETGNCCQD